MAIPTSRTTLIDYCLRELGDPVTEINVDDDQLEDRMDEALQYFGENIFDGIEKMFLIHTVTATDVTNKYIDAVDPIVGVIRVFPASGLFSGSFFDQEFQLRVTDLDAFTGISMIDFYINQTNFRLMENLLATEKSFRFNKVKNRIELDTLWGRDVKEGTILVFEVYRIVDPEAFVEIYNHAFLKKYLTALIKKQWGMNLKKFDGVQLPSGITLNGQVIYDEAVEQITKLEDEVLSKWSEPINDLIG